MKAPVRTQFLLQFVIIFSLFSIFEFLAYSSSSIHKRGRKRLDRKMQTGKGGGENMMEFIIYYSIPLCLFPHKKTLATEYTLSYSTNLFAQYSTNKLYKHKQTNRIVQT